SATVGDPKEVGAFLTGDRGCEIIEISAGSKTDITVIEPAVTDADKSLAKELMTEPEFASQIRRIYEIVEEHDSTLIFVNTRQTAEALGSRFRELD
ncbi:MAG: helicase, partial [Halobacteriaceae archaeon]